MHVEPVDLGRLRVGVQPRERQQRFVLVEQIDCGGPALDRVEVAGGDGRSRRSDERRRPDRGLTTADDLTEARDAGHVDEGPACRADAVVPDADGRLDGVVAGSLEGGHADRGR